MPINLNRTIFPKMIWSGRIIISKWAIRNLCILVALNMDLNMGWGLWSLRRLFIRDGLVWIIRMVRGSFCIPITPSILVISPMISRMDTGCSSTAISILLGISRMVPCMVMACGKTKRAKNISVNGKPTKLMAMEFMSPKTVITKVNTNII